MAQNGSASSVACSACSPTGFWRILPHQATRIAHIAMRVRRQIAGARGVSRALGKSLFYGVIISTNNVQLMASMAIMAAGEKGGGLERRVVKSTVKAIRATVGRRQAASAHSALGLRSASCIIHRTALSCRGRRCLRQHLLFSASHRWRRIYQAVRCGKQAT